MHSIDGRSTHYPECGEAKMAFEDSELAQKHGLSSCSFQSFSRTAPIHHFYDSELWLSTWKDEPEMYEAPDMVLFF